MQRIGDRPPVEHGVLRVEQILDVALQSRCLMADAVVALQHGDVADGVSHMGEHCVVVALDRGLPRLGAAHDKPADAQIKRAEAEQHHRHAHVHGESGRNQQRQRDGRRQVLAHEFEPKAKQRLDGAQQRVQRIGGAALVMPGERHGDDALEGLAQHFRAAGMGKTIGAARHQNESDNVEGAKGCPDSEGRKHRTVIGNGVDHPAEQDRLQDGDHSERDVGAADQRNALLVSRQITQCSPVDLQK